MLDVIREHMATFLREKGFTVVTAYCSSLSTKNSAATLSLSLRSATSETAGFGHYLGEQYNEETSTWEELYGRKIDITFGLDLYGGESQMVADAFDALVDSLHLEGPTGLHIITVSGGELSYKKDLALFYHPAQVTCQAYIYAVAQEGDIFTDFEVRGVTI